MRAHLVPLLVLLVVASPVRASAQASDSAGVRVVTNPVPGPNAPAFRLSARPRASIGVVEGAPEYQLFQASRGTVLSDGSILVVNAGTQEARIYDKAGKYLRSVGKKGQGPGEFMGIVLVGVLPGDSLVFSDPQQKRISVFTSSGALARTITWPSDLGIFVDTWGLLGDGRIAVSGRTLPKPLNPGAVVRNPLAVSWLSVRNESLAPFGEFPGTQGFQTGMTSAPLIFGRGLAIAARRDRIAVANDDAYSIRVYDGSGKMLQIVREPRGPVKVGPGEWEDALPPVFKDPNARPNPFKKAYDEQPHLETRPPWGGWCSPSCLRLDQAGNVWAQEFKPNAFAERESWHVFDPRGTFIGKLDLPPKTLILDAGADWILLRQTDDLDVEHVVLYGLERVPGK